jgi:hypothetical protein
MATKVEPGKTYIGVIEDNNDPKKVGRCRVRVLDVFDGRNKEGKFIIPTEELPWAFPWKDLNGNGFNLPEMGKVVIVVFENGNQNNPEYISADHYNINLEKKLESLSKEDYLSMKALIFDHKTQIYVNDSEGLKLDHKFNNINIKEQSINVNLKDNFGKVNLGSAKSTQRAILGDNFINWLDEFLNIIMGSKGGPFLGNFGAPVIATPAMMAHIQLYQSIRDPKILSKNVYIVDNENVEKLDRIADGQLGDKWESTVEKNEITKTEEVPYTPVDGSTSTTFDKPTEATSATASTPSALVSKVKDENPDVKVLREILKSKNYTEYSDPYKMNIIAVRNQCIKSGDKYTDEFVDRLYLMYKDEEDTWQVKQYVFSTVPGVEFTVTDNWINGKNFDMKTFDYWDSKLNEKTTMKSFVKNSPNFSLQILVPSQYLETYEISTYLGSPAMITRQGAMQMVWYDKEYDRPEFLPDNMKSPIKTNPLGNGDFKIGIHLGYPGGKKVGNWSEDGSQVFSTSDELNDFFSYCEKHKEKYGNSFTYTLVTKNDWNSATGNVESNKNDNPPSPETTEQPTTTTTTTKPVSTIGTKEDYFLFSYDENGKKGDESGMKLDDLMLSVRIRSSKEQSDNDLVLWMVKTNSKEFLIYTEAIKMINNDTGLYLETDEYFAKKFTTVTEKELKKLIESKEKQLIEVERFLKTGTDGTWKIIQDPWDPNKKP